MRKSKDAADCAPPPPMMQRRHSDKPVTKPPIELPLRKNYSVIETAKSRPRPKSNQATGAVAAATISTTTVAAASNLPPPPLLQQPQKTQLCQKTSIATESIAEDLLISFDPPPKEKNPLFEEIENLYSEPINSLSHGAYMTIPRGTSLGNSQQQNQSPGRVSNPGLPALPPTRPVEKFQPKFMSPQHLPSNDGSFSSLPPQERMVKSESWTGISLSHTQQKATTPGASGASSGRLTRSELPTSQSDYSF